MRPVVCLLLAVLLAACGRTEPVRYPYDAGEADAGEDGGVDAGVVGCVQGVLTLTRATPQVMFVLDRSGSMGSRFGGGLTRWRSLGTALGSVLPPVDDSMAMGALVFPQGVGQSCSVPGAPNLSPAVGNADALVRLITTQSPGGHTPTADAIHAAAQALLATHTATRARALVVATDGAPNCNAALDPRTCVCANGGRCTDALMCLDDRRTVGEVATALAQGVPTWVIGIQDGSAAAIDTLNEMARAGGHPRQGAPQDYYAVTSETALEDALTEIRSQVGACVYLTGSVPPEDQAIVITVDGAPVPLDPSGAGAGWSWTSRDNGEIALRGLWCTLASTPFARLEAHVTCGAPDGG